MEKNICPKCRNRTFFSTPTGRKCSKCGYTMFVPANDGKGGRGKQCRNCGNFQVFSGKCRNCGAVYSGLT